jgi:3-dehydroquinate dehydratase-2
VILNPGGFTRTSLSILDAIKAIAKPVIELHMGNPHKRESYRGASFISHGAYGIIAGVRGYGYVIALDAIVNALAEQAPSPPSPAPARRRPAAPAKRRALPVRCK